MLAGMYGTGLSSAARQPARRPHPISTGPIIPCRRRWPRFAASRPGWFGGRCAPLPGARVQHPPPVVWATRQRVPSSKREVTTLLLVEV